MRLVVIVGLFVLIVISEKFLFFFCNCFPLLMFFLLLFLLCLNKLLYAFAIVVGFYLFMFFVFDFVFVNFIFMLHCLKSLFLQLFLSPQSIPHFLQFSSNFCFFNRLFVSFLLLLLFFFYFYILFLLLLFYFKFNSFNVYL